MKLYPHQGPGADALAANRWMALWDEQGLGKTVTAIVACDRAGIEDVLCIVPTAVLFNWYREWRQWSPGRTVQVIETGSDELVGADVTIVSHGMIFRPGITDQLCSRRWGQTIVDEHHCFRTHSTKRTMALVGDVSDWPDVSGIRARTEGMWSLTGTPMPNDASNLWTHFYGQWPDRILGAKTKKPLGWYAFRQNFCELRETHYGVKVVRNKNSAELKKRLAGTFLRRREGEHVKLPPLRYESVSVRPTNLPADLRAVEQRIGSSLRGAIVEAEDSEDPGSVLKIMGQQEDFSRWRRLCGMVKAEAGAELIFDELKDSTHKVVLFAHHLDVVETLAAKLARFGVVAITGSVSASERQRLVSFFQTGAPRVAICQLIAGGVGITLTAACDLVFFEMSPVPGENAQAAKRCHRIGQTRSVRVRFLSLSGSVDEPFSEILRAKTAMIREVLT